MLKTFHHFIMSEKDALIVALNAKVEQQRATIAMMRPMYNIGHDLCVRIELHGDVFTLAFDGDQHSVHRGLDQWEYVPFGFASEFFELRTPSLSTRIVLSQTRLYVTLPHNNIHVYTYPKSQREMLMDQFSQVINAWNAVAAEPRLYYSLH